MNKQVCAFWLKEAYQGTQTLQKENKGLLGVLVILFRSEGGLRGGIFRGAGV